MSFDTNENKELLWDVLENTGKFKSLSPSLLKSVKYEFETTITEINKTYSNLALLDKNKVFMKNFTYKLNTFQNTPDFFSQNLNQQSYTSKDIQKEREEEMNMDFNQKKREMDEMLIVKKPNEIDFSDISKKTDQVDQPIENIDAILRKTIEQRNMETETINSSYDQKKAKKWLDREKKITFKEETENIILNTYDTEPLSEIPDTPNDLTTTIESLSTNQDSTKIFDILEIILTNQTKILKEMELISEKLSQGDLSGETPEIQI